MGQQDVEDHGRTMRGLRSAFSALFDSFLPQNTEEQQ